MPLIEALAPNTDTRGLVERCEQTLGAGSIVGTWVWDVCQDVFHPDEQFALTVGLQLDQCRTGVPLERGIALLHPDDRERHSAIVETALEHGGPYRSEYRLLYADGVHRWVEALGRVDVDEEGRPVRVPGMLVDIDDRKRAQDALINRNNLLRAFIEALPNPVFAKDPEGRFLFTSRSVAELTGRSLREIVGRTATELFEAKAQAAAAVANDGRIMATGVAERFEQQLDVRGTQLWFETTKAPLRGPGGNVIGLIGSSVDITERKRVDAQTQVLLALLDSHLRETLALIQAMARESLGDGVAGNGLPDYERRLTVLESVHDQLTKGGWQCADLDDLIRELAGDVLDRLRLEGPLILLPPQVAVGLGVAIGELVSAACRCGALSNPAGSVTVRWNRSADGRLQLSWREIGAAPATASGRTHRLLETVMASVPGGGATIRLEAAGFVCDLSATL